MPWSVPDGTGLAVSSIIICVLGSLTFLFPHLTEQQGVPRPHKTRTHSCTHTTHRERRRMKDRGIGEGGVEGSHRQRERER